MSRRAGRGFMNEKLSFCSILQTISRIEITNYFNYEPRFNGVFSRNTLPRIKDEPDVINLNDKKSKGTHWI